MTPSFAAGGMIAIVIGASFLLLTACADETRRDAESWLGKDERELRAKFGPPNSEVPKENGRRSLNYVGLYDSGLKRCIIGFDVGRTGYVIEVFYKSCPTDGVRIKRGD